MCEYQQDLICGSSGDFVYGSSTISPDQFGRMDSFNNYSASAGGNFASANTDYFQFDTFPNSTMDVAERHDWPFVTPFPMFHSLTQPIYTPEINFFAQHPFDQEPLEPPSSFHSPIENSLQARKLFIGGISYDTTSEELKIYFSQWGDVVDSVVITDSITNKSRGFGFVVYQTVEMAETAMQNRPHRVKGKRVDSKKAISREEMKQQQWITEETQQKSVKHHQFTRKHLYNPNPLHLNNNANFPKPIAKPAQPLKMHEFPVLN